MMFSLPNLIAGFLFGGIGFVAFVYGKKLSRFQPMLIGVALMTYPYLVSNPWLLYGIGIALTAALYFTRET